MPIDVETLLSDQLQNLLSNYRRKGAQGSEVYVKALRALEKRTGRGLDFDKSYSIILRAAKESRFLSYKELADGSGADWGKVHYAIGEHLWRPVEYSHSMGWPMLSAIVVNKPNIATGSMEPETLKGFIAAAHDLGYSIVDEKAFLKEQQAQVFAWAQGLAAETPADS